MTMPAHRPEPELQRFPHSAADFLRYESAADPDECLHLPVEQCDHRTFRCAHCCAHAG